MAKREKESRDERKARKKAALAALRTGAEVNVSIADGDIARLEAMQR